MSDEGCIFSRQAWSKLTNLKKISLSQTVRSMVVVLIYFGVDPEQVEKP